TLGGLHHREADAIFDAAARVQVLELGPHLGADALELWEPVQADDRRPADEIEDGGADVTRKRHAIVARARERHDSHGVDGGSTPRVVVLFPGALGDLVLAMPALGGLRARHADAHLTLVVAGWLEALAATSGVADSIAGLDDADAAGLFGGTRLPAWIGQRP